MTDAQENLTDLSPEAVARHIAAGRAARSLIVHRALAAIRARLRRPALTPELARVAGLNA